MISSKDEEVMFDGLLLSSRGPAFWPCGQVDLLKKQPATHYIIQHD